MQLGERLRAVLVDEGVDDRVKRAAALAAEDDVAGEQADRDRVARGATFAAGGERAGGPGGVEAVGVNFLFRAHGGLRRRVKLHGARSASLSPLAARCAFALSGAQRLAQNRGNWAHNAVLQDFSRAQSAARRSAQTRNSTLMSGRKED